MFKPHTAHVYTIFTILFLIYNVHLSSASYFNATADNTFALWINGVQRVTLCPDDQTVESGSPISNCAWTNTTSVNFGDDITPGQTVIAFQGHNALGTNTNPLTGGQNPGAIIYTLTITGVGICDPLTYFYCIDDLQSKTLYTGSATPPVTWSTDPAFDTDGWYYGPLDDLGVNGPKAWENFPAPAPTLYGGDSLWFHEQGASKGVATDAHWQWYRHNVSNTNIFCRLVIPANGGCPPSTDNPPPVNKPCLITGQAV